MRVAVRISSLALSDHASAWLEGTTQVGWRRIGLDSVAPPGLLHAEPDGPLSTHTDYCGGIDALWG